MKNQAPNAVAELLQMNLAERLAGDGQPVTVAEFKARFAPAYDAAISDTVKDALSVKKTGTHTVEVSFPADLLKLTPRG
jgi:pyruvate/2-oxoglutarate dehydrogenase complex dihydrolipoamide dehydrogenase (E3) component